MRARVGALGLFRGRMPGRIVGRRTGRQGGPSAIGRRSWTPGVRSVAELGVE